MKLETARKVSILFTAPELVDGLIALTHERIELYRGKLESEQDIERIRQYQGAIIELRRFGALHDEVKQALSHGD